MTIYRPLASLVLLLVLEGGCGPRSETPQAKLQKFDFLIDWQAEPTYLGIYYAKETGAFRKLGLDVDIIQSWGANQAISAVAAGRYKISTASGGATVLGYNSGAQIVSLGVLYQRVPTVVYGLASSGIREPRDLIGKKIGIYPGSITKNEFDAFVKANGLNPARMTIVSLSGPDIPLLLAHKVDAVLHYTEMSPVQVELNPGVKAVDGRKTFEIHLADHGVKGYGLNIVTSRQSYDAAPDLLKSVAAVAVGGYRAGCQEPEKAVAAFTKEFPDKDPNYVRLSWQRVCQMLGPDPGSQTAAGWRETIQVYQSLGLLKEQVDPRSVLP